VQIRVHETGGKTLATIPFPRTDLYRAPSSNIGPPLALHVAFSPDGGQIAIGYDQALAVHHAVTGECRFLDGKLPDIITGVAFDPGGKWLYVGRRDGTLVAHRTDIISNERSVVFRWSLGPIHALAMCGDALLAACDEGVQVWPMAKLLEGM
jgi:WD40 repeat protein